MGYSVDSMVIDIGTRLHFKESSYNCFERYRLHYKMLSNAIMIGQLATVSAQDYRML